MAARWCSMVPQPKPKNQTGLDSEYSFSAKQLLQFERLGHTCMRGFLQTSDVERCRPVVQSATAERELDALRHRVSVLCPKVNLDSITSVEEAEQALERSATDEVGFLQLYNLHLDFPEIDKLVRSRRIAGAAAALLGTNRVRLYQSTVFLKRPGDGPTHWHSDLNMVPIDTNQFVTIWIPLRPIGDDDSGLEFAGGSHRDFGLPYWHELGFDLETRGYEVESAGAMALGDVTFHAGWTLHYAPPADLDAPPRLALAASYFADGAPVLPHKKDASAEGFFMRQFPNTEDAQAYEGWVNDIPPGYPAVHPKLPLVYPPPRPVKKMNSGSKSQPFKG